MLTVGHVTARPGERVSGFIDVPAAGDPGTRIPVTIITGIDDGPVLALTAGIHGSEPSPILALQRLREMVDPGMLRGSIIMVHVANVPSFEHRTIYRGPWDQKNLNRVFPGSPSGTASERIAHAITTQVIDRCDALVDMHSGDGNEALHPYAYWNHLGLSDDVDNRARDMACAFGLGYIVIDRGRPRDPSATLFCSNTAHVRGKPAVTTEAGGVGVPTADMVDANVQGAMRVIRHLRMLPPDESAPPPVPPVWLEPSEVLYSTVAGLWYPAVAPGDRVERGQLIGRATDYFGVELGEVTSPMDGVVLYVVVSPAMGVGEPCAMVAHISSEHGAPHLHG